MIPGFVTNAAIVSLMAVLLLFRSIPAMAQAPIITNQPASLQVPLGGSAVFTVGVDGSGPFTYQWLFNGTNFPGILSTVSGSNQLQLFRYTGLAVGPDGSLFVADPGHQRICKLGSDGNTTTVAGGGSDGAGGPATNAWLPWPAGVAVDTIGNLYLTADGGAYKVDTNGTITLLTAGLFSPEGLVVDTLGNIFIANSWANQIIKVDTNAVSSRFATNVSLDLPTAVALNAANDLYIADQNNSRVLKVSVSGVATTVAGNRTQDYSGDGGAATNAGLMLPQGVAVDNEGALLISDTEHNCIRKVDTNGVISTIAGNGAYGYSGDNGPSTAATLNSPTGLAVDNNGDVFIADSNNNCVRKLTFVSGPTLTLTNVTLDNAGSFQVKVSGPSGSVTSSVATLIVLAEPTIVLISPPAQVVPYGVSASFNVVAKGTPPMQYQWLFQGALITGATNTNLSLQSLSTNDEGSYSVIVTNAVGSVTSSPVTLSVIRNRPAEPSYAEV